MKKMRFGSNYLKSSVKVKIWLPEILLVQNNKLKVIKEESNNNSNQRLQESLLSNCHVLSWKVWKEVKVKGQIISE